MQLTIMRLYENPSDAFNVVRALEEAGFPKDDISVIACPGASEVTQDHSAPPTIAVEAGAGAGLGSVVGAGGGLLAGLGILAIPGLGPVVAAGWLAATAAGAVAGAVAGGAVGGLVGALTEEGITEDDAKVYAAGIGRGGSLVTVRAEEVQATEAERILDSHHPAYRYGQGQDSAAPVREAISDEDGEQVPAEGGQASVRRPARAEPTDQYGGRLG